MISVEEIDARLAALTEQRNVALDAVVLWKAKAQVLEAQLAVALETKKAELSRETADG